MNLLKPVEDENAKGSLILDLILGISGIAVASPTGDPTGIVAAVCTRIIREVVHRVILPLTSRNESKRLCDWGKQAVEGIAQRLNDGEEFRKDGVFEETPTNRSNWEEVVESTLKKVIDTTEEPKIKFMANLTENFHFDEDLDMNTYRQILNDLDKLSYRQLCIIGVVILYKNKEVNMSPIGVTEGHIGAVEKKDMEHIQMPQDEQTRFYSIGRDFQKLIDNRYLQTAIAENVDRNEPFLDSLHADQIPEYTLRLHSFANLDQIPIKDIEKTFSIWDVRLKKEGEL